MTRLYNLDFSIERDVDRCKAVQQILANLDQSLLTPNDLDEFARYIYYGKTQQGQHATVMAHDVRHRTYLRKVDKEMSLDELLQAPTFSEASVASPYQRSATRRAPRISRPKYDKDGSMVDPGDSDVPGMVELWERIEEMERRLRVYQGKLEPTPQDTDLAFMNPYRIYAFKHLLLELRRSQYVLKDMFKKPIKFENIQSPARTYVNWDTDSYYWMRPDQWQARVNTPAARCHGISNRIQDYEVREDGCIKWVVREQAFDWENIEHIRALFKHYTDLKSWAENCPFLTWSQTLVFDLQRYISWLDLPPLRKRALELRLRGLDFYTIAKTIAEEFNEPSYTYSRAIHMINTTIAEYVIECAKLARILSWWPRDQFSQCVSCGHWYPNSKLFFSTRIKKNLCRNCNHHCTDHTKMPKNERSLAYDKWWSRHFNPLPHIQNEREIFQLKGGVK